MNIGIIGQGFVGSAIREGLKDFYNILTYDLDPSKCNSNLIDVTERSDIVFVCVPTPMRKDGSCDTRILESVIDDVYRVYIDSQIKKPPVLVIKSTVTPGTTQRINDNYEDMVILFSPEFLTEANSFNDFKNQNRIVIGVPKKNKNEKTVSCFDEAYLLRDMFKKVFPSIAMPMYNSSEAEMCKYFINCFLATKVIFSNQMFDICNAAGLSYENIKNMALLDPRIGDSHMSVPGPDGDRGFGGHCFPKDLEAMISFGMDNGAPFSVSFLQEVKIYNDLVRENRDWEKMKGRAISED
jgi:UDPglucose 6-dehydrogenase